MPCISNKRNWTGGLAKLVLLPQNADTDVAIPSSGILLLGYVSILSVKLYANLTLKMEAGNTYEVGNT